MKYSFILTAFALFGASLSSAAQTFEPLQIVADGEVHEFRVEIADDPEETAQGLMNRESMDPDAGMLFDFGDPREANMWMKNTLISLDMLFLGSDGEILAIAERARPGSLRRINPGFPVKGVLEINGGLSETLGVEPGDQVRHRIFEVADAPE